MAAFEILDEGMTEDAVPSIEIGQLLRRLDPDNLSMRKAGDREGLVPSGALIEGSRVRNGLAVGERRIRTLGPP